jgi:hypothetical protein
LVNGMLLEPVHGDVSRISGQLSEGGNLTAKDLLAPSAGRSEDTARAHRNPPTGPDYPLQYVARGSIKRSQDRNLVWAHRIHAPMLARVARDKHGRCQLRTISKIRSANVSHAAFATPVIESILPELLIEHFGRT